MNKTLEYALKVKTSLGYDDAIKKVTELLKEEGFGILTEIDAKATLKKKIDVDFKKYIILGACNPRFAYKTLEAENLIGVFLPCNIIVYEEMEGSVVAAMNPYLMAEMINNEKVKEVAVKVTAIFKGILRKMGDI